MRWYRAAHMWAFDLIELDGADMRREPLAQRKASLERALARATPGLRFNEHLHDEDGPLVFHHVEAQSAGIAGWECNVGEKRRQDVGVGSDGGIGLKRVVVPARVDDLVA